MGRFSRTALPSLLWASSLPAAIVHNLPTPGALPEPLTSVVVGSSVVIATVVVAIRWGRKFIGS